MIRLIVVCAVVLRAALAVATEPAEPRAADLDSLIWVNEEAAADSLASYWRGLDQRWYEPLTLEELDLFTDPARRDSLTAAGDAAIARMLEGRPWRLDLSPLSGLRFNRVEGFTPSASLTVDRPGARQPDWTTTVGWATAWKQAVFETKLSLPLATARPRDDEGRLTRAPWTALELELSGGRTVPWFAGDKRFMRDVAGLIHGRDPNHYYEQRGWEAVLHARPRPHLSLSLGIGGGRDLPLDTHTRWSVRGDDADVPDNLRVPALSRRTVGARLAWSRPWIDTRVGVSWNRVSDADAALLDDGAPAWYRRLDAGTRVTRHDPLRNTWVLRGSWTSVDRQAPLQWKTWLGDWGTLRGYEAQELVGDRGGWASLDVRWNLDPFRTLRIPVLKKLGLQPVTFVEAGRTWSADGGDPLLEPAMGAQGWRADAGFGLSRTIGFGERGPTSLRLYAAKPLGQDMDDRPWRYVVAIEWW